jgi:hypothetical protein
MASEQETRYEVRVDGTLIGFVQRQKSRYAWFGEVTAWRWTSVCGHIAAGQEIDGRHGFSSVPTRAMAVEELMSGLSKHVCPDA